MGILRIFFLFIYALIPFGQIVRQIVVPGVVVTPLDVIVFLFGVFLAGYILLTKTKVVFEKYHIFLAGFLIIGLVSLLLHVRFLTIQEFFSAFGYFARFFIYILPLFLLPSLIQKGGKKLISELAVVGFLFVVLGIFQYFYLPRLELLIFLGEWDIHSFRLFSSIFDPNFAGLFLIFEIFLLISVLARGGSKKYMYYFMLVASYVCLFLTFSRSSMLAAGIGIISYLILLRKWKVIIIFVLIFFLSIFSLGLFSRNFSGEGVKILRTASIQTRLTSFEEGFGMFLKNPIIGVGFNAYKYAKNDYRDLDVNQVSSNASNAPSNSLIFMLATTGILGFASFCLCMYFLTKKLFYIMNKSEKKGVVASSLACIVAFLVHSLFQNSLFYSSTLIIFVLYIVGILTYDYSRE